jgi:hypothetical protein
MAAIETANLFGAFGLVFALALLIRTSRSWSAGWRPSRPWAAAQASELDRLVGAVFLSVESQLGLAGPIVAYAASPDAASRRLDGVKAWLLRRNHPLNLAVLLVFGALFTLSGINDL